MTVDTAFIGNLTTWFCQLLQQSSAQGQPSTQKPKEELGQSLFKAQRRECFEWNGELTERAVPTGTLLLLTVHWMVQFINTSLCVEQSRTQTFTQIHKRTFSGSLCPCKVNWGSDENVRITRSPVFQSFWKHITLYLGVWNFMLYILKKKKKVTFSLLIVWTEAEKCKPQTSMLTQ